VNPSILLLDCSRHLKKRLKRQGFDVVSGTVGFATGIAFLPAPIYEYDVIVYSPKSTDAARKKKITKKDDTESLPTEGSPLEAELRRHYEMSISANQTTAGDFEPLSGNIKRGANVLIFINHVSDSIERLNAAYWWVPNMPQISPTQDFKPLIPDQLADEFQDVINELSPMLILEDLKSPVRHKIMLNEAFNWSVPLFLNRQSDYLGLFLKIGEGRIIMLPEYMNNEYVITNFLNRVLPRLSGQPSRSDLVDAFKSPMEERARDEIDKIESQRKELEESFEAAKIKLVSAERKKMRTLESDETAVRVIAYFKQATQDDDAALFYLYKIIDALEKKFGGAAAAKQKLGNHADWRLIGRITNASYGDIRHAPRPGEVIKRWTKDEIAECFAAAERVLTAYFSTLFEQS
jgi:hypothetical protein